MKNITLVFSLSTLILSQTGFAEKLSDKTLDLLSAEAVETDMSKAASVASSTDEPDIVPSEPSDSEALADSITKQLSAILGGSNKTPDDEEIANKLENVVSSALLEGANMDDLRSAVSLAMDDLKVNAETEGTTAKVEQVSDALDKLVGEAKQEDPVEVEVEDVVKAQQQEEKALEAAVLSTIAPVPVAASPATKAASERSLPETVTVLVGESLYKVALRVYGRGDDYLRLYEANKETIIDPNIIQVGQVLRVPGNE